MLSVKETAQYLSVSAKTVYRLAHERKLVHYKIGRRTLFRMQDLEGYLARCRVETVEEVESRLKAY